MKQIIFPAIKNQKRFLELYSSAFKCPALEDR